MCCSIRITWMGFDGQAILAAAMALVSNGAFALERVRKGNDKMFLYARIAAAAALIIGPANALLVCSLCIAVSPWGCIFRQSQQRIHVLSHNSRCHEIGMTEG